MLLANVRLLNVAVHVVPAVAVVRPELAAIAGVVRFALYEVLVVLHTYTHTRARVGKVRTSFSSESSSLSRRRKSLGFKVKYEATAAEGKLPF